MTKFSYIYLLAALSCSIIDAADQGSPAPLAGTKRHRSTSDASAASLDHPSTPVSQTFKKVSSAGNICMTPAKDVPTPLRDLLPDGLDSSKKKARALFALQSAKAYASPARKACAEVVNGMVNYEVLRPQYEAAQAAGISIPLGHVQAAVVDGNYSEQASRKHANVGVKKGQKRQAMLFDLTDALLEADCSVTPAVDLAHMAGRPVIENNGTLTGGHALSGYEDPAFTIVRQVNLPDHSGACAIEVSYTSPRGFDFKRGKTVWFGEAASEGAIAQRVLDANIIGVNKDGNKHLLQSPDGPCIGFLKGAASYGVTFPTRFIRADELASSEIVLGTSDGGAQVVISSEEVKHSIREQLRIGAKITPFKDFKGTYILSGVEIPGLPSGGSVELTADLQAELSPSLPAVPELVSPVKTGKPIKFKPANSLVMGGFVRSVSPMRQPVLSAPCGDAYSSSGHELK